MGLTAAGEPVALLGVSTSVMRPTALLVNVCVAAIAFARIRRLYYGAPDPKGGAVEHGPKFFAQPTCHHRPLVERTGDAEASGTLLREFFRSRRG